MVCFLHYFICLFIANVNSMRGHDNKPQKCPNNASKHIFWAKGMFFYHLSYFIIFYSNLLPPTTLQHYPTPRTTPSTSQLAAQSHTTTATSPGSRSIKRVGKIPFFCFGYVFTSPQPFPPHQSHIWLFLCVFD